jgi:hypothetical protein
MDGIAERDSIRPDHALRLVRSSHRSHAAVNEPDAGGTLADGARRIGPRHRPAAMVIAHCGAATRRSGRPVQT